MERVQNLGKEMTFEEYKEVILDILLTIDLFCKKNGINYSLSCGSLLGAIRHKGFIPWDDDIDIQLLRDDYNKLIASFPEQYKDVSLICLERDKKWDRAYAKAYNKKTIELESTTSNIGFIGVGIDVFPIDAVPDDEKNWQKYNANRLLLQKVYSMKFIEFRKERSFKKNFFLAISKALLLPFSLRYLAEQIDKMGQRFNGINTMYVFENCQGIGKRRDRFLRKDFEEYIDVEFENHMLKAPVGYDDYLTNTYGDYLQLPPEEKRVGHHSFKAYWK